MQYLTLHSANKNNKKLLIIHKEIQKKFRHLEQPFPYPLIMLILGQKIMWKTMFLCHLHIAGG